MVPPSSPERAPNSIPSMLQDSIVGHSSYSQLVERPFSPSAISQDSPCLTTLTGLGVCLEQRYGADLSTNETHTGIEDGDEDLNYQNRWEYVYRDRRRDSPMSGLLHGETLNDSQCETLRESSTRVLPWSDEHLAEIQSQIDAQFSSPHLPHQTMLYNSLPSSSILSVRRLTNKRRVFRALAHASTEVHELEQKLLAAREKRVLYEMYMAYSGLSL
ncbi:hypothetical protein NMY22_g17898 [Coprinellus aureogranulatus]|nr:hypothetical protein NMY22_g17898 [Coprinellus aureogranulatus]